MSRRSCANYANMVSMQRLKNVNGKRTLLNLWDSIALQMESKWTRKRSEQSWTG